MRSILITGSSSGIGYDAAVSLKARGWRVFASCRKAEDCARLIEEGFESPLIDYAESATIDTGLAEVLEATGGTLDALFNNGAFGIPGLVEDLPRGALRSIYETNVFGVHELTTKVIPVMRAQGHGRIINNSSVLGFITMKWRGAYNSTKFALEGLTNTLRIEMRGLPIHIITVQPGPITSKIRENSIPHFEKWIDWENAARAEHYRKGIAKRLYEDNGPDVFELPASAVSRKLIHALESPRPRARYKITTPTYLMAIFKRLLPTRMLDWVLDRL